MSYIDKFSYFYNQNWSSYNILRCNRRTDGVQFQFDSPGDTDLKYVYLIWYYLHLEESHFLYVTVKYNKCAVFT